MFELLVIVKAGDSIARIILPGVTEYRYSPNTNCFTIIKGDVRLFFPRENVIYIGKNHDDMEVKM